MSAAIEIKHSLDEEIPKECILKLYVFWGAQKIGEREFKAGEEIHIGHNQNGAGATHQSESDLEQTNCFNGELWQAKLPDSFIAYVEAKGQMLPLSSGAHFKLSYGESLHLEVDDMVFVYSVKEAFTLNEKNNDSWTRKFFSRLRSMFIR